jgi:hypothetical protein
VTLAFLRGGVSSSESESESESESSESDPESEESEPSAVFLSFSPFAKLYLAWVIGSVNAAAAHCSFANVIGNQPCMYPIWKRMY